MFQDSLEDNRARAMDKALVYNFVHYFEYNLEYGFAKDSLKDNKAEG